MTQGAGSGLVQDTHTYNDPGIYTVELTVLDDDGGVGNSILQHIVVYDPSGSFVTGGGTIDSPAGIYGFMLTAIDGQLSGNDSKDKFHIRIWDINDVVSVIYDNGLGEQAEDSDPFAPHFPYNPSGPAAKLSLII